MKPMILLAMLCLATGAGAQAPAQAATPESRTVRGQSAGTTARDTLAGKEKESFRREVFAYERGGRRDPFESLMQSGELRPLISDLKLVSVVFDATNRNSVAILRDLGTKEQYRVKVGQSLGRMRVARIAQKSVVFTIEEFGYSRQQELALGDSNQERMK